MKSVCAPQLCVINTARWSANFSSNADNNAALEAELQLARNHVQRLSIENSQVREQLLQAQEAQERDGAELAALKHHVEIVGKELERERSALLPAVQSLAEAQSN
jgi:small-conductance mechanosensitive channel